jgi:hypothetical protein
MVVACVPWTPVVVSTFKQMFCQLREPRQTENSRGTGDHFPFYFVSNTKELKMRINLESFFSLVSTSLMKILSQWEIIKIKPLFGQVNRHYWYRFRSQIPNKPHSWSLMQNQRQKNCLFFSHLHDWCIKELASCFVYLETLNIYANPCHNT